MMTAAPATMRAPGPPSFAARVRLAGGAALVGVGDATAAGAVVSALVVGVGGLVAGVGASVGSGVGATVGRGVVETDGRGVGAEGGAVGTTVGLAGARTVTVPLMELPWIPQMYANVPGVLNVMEAL
jgi:hypothetical protein